MLSFFPRDVLDEILNLIESVSEGFPSYSFIGITVLPVVKEIFAIKYVAELCDQSIHYKKSCLCCLSCYKKKYA